MEDILSTRREGNQVWKMHYTMLRWRIKGVNRERSGGLFQPKWFCALKYRENMINTADTNRQMVNTLTYLNPTLNHCRIYFILIKSNFFLLCGCVNINKLQDGQPDGRTGGLNTCNQGVSNWRDSISKPATRETRMFVYSKTSVLTIWR